MNKRTLILAAVLISSAAMADQTWIPVGETDESAWDIKNGSLQFGKDKQGEPSAMVLGRVRSFADRNVSFYRWHISSADCAKQAGKLYVLSMDGEEVGVLDYVEDGGNMTAAIGEMICASAVKASRSMTE